jgi:hypothetical protein
MRLLAALTTSTLLLACAAGGSSDTSTEDDAGGGGAGATGGNGGAAGFVPSGGGGAGGDDLILYVHTDTTLLRADPRDPELTLEQLGDFDCIGASGQDEAMTDVAVNAAGEVWGVSATAVHRLQVSGGVVSCGMTVTLDNPEEERFYALTFAPAGVLGEEEVLVAGNSAGELWSIDASGALAQRGQFGNVPTNDGNGHTYEHAGKAWELSGDIVFVDGGGEPLGFATLRDCPNPPSSSGCNTTDTLVELDVEAMKTATTQAITKSVRGQIVKSPSCDDPDNEGYGSVYGIAAFDDKVLGFARVTTGGFAISISNTNGSACLVKSYSARWAGAGITTLAPAVPPPPN